jgi:hypothetical protein
MLDHAGFILAHASHHAITLLTISKNWKIGNQVPEKVFSTGTKILVDGGLSTGRIHTRVINDASPDKAILKEADKGKFAAVAVGRTGEGKGMLQKLFVGSVSDSLFQDLKGSALWLA